jgi:putative membrane protein
MKKQKTKIDKVPAALLGFYAGLFLILAINPTDRMTWLVENMTVWIVLSAIIGLYALKIRFSDASYIFMAIFIYLHTIGGHWTFAEVPFERMTDFFGFERNNFDRFAHFAVGLYAFPIVEWLYAKKMVANRFLLFTYPVFAIATVAMSYELIEWIYASISNLVAGMAYLGSQGDIWDAQKDMFCDTSGAIVAVAIYFLANKKDLLKFDRRKV